VPLDRRGQWYRYHHLFRDMLLAELERTEPGLVPVLRQRAAGWCLRSGLPEEALEYAMAAGDVDLAAALVERLAVPARRQGRITTVQRWFQWLDDRGGIEGHPMLAVLAVLIYAWLGRPVETERWADVVDRWPEGGADPAVRAWAALSRAFTCRHGVVRMLADADQAARTFPATGLVTSAPALLQGIARVIAGDLDGGDAALADAASGGAQAGAHDIAAEALAQRSLLAMARGDWGRAEVLAGQSGATLREGGIEESYVLPLTGAVQARAAIHRGDLRAARQHLVSAQRARPLLTYAIPYVAVQARIELARVHLALADMAAARMLMREIDEVLRRRPGLGTLVADAQELRTRMSADARPGAPGASSLTSAELRVLPLLSTHMSFPEIAAEMYLSPNTVKSQAVSLYRKLGVSSRSGAVARARELALLDG
jgi:LuxR family maltose regulon positive regulatory protein